MHQTDTTQVETTEKPRKRRGLRLLLIGAGVGLAFTAGTMLMDQFTASASAAVMPVEQENAQILAETETPDAPVAPVVPDAEVATLDTAITEADALMASSADQVADPATRDHLAGLVTRANEIKGRIADGSHTVEDVTELGTIVGQIRDAMSSVSDSVTQAEADRAAEAQAAEQQAAEQQAAPAPAADSAPADDPAPAADPAPAENANGTDWTLYADGYCGGPECAQSAVDSSNLALVDYGTGYIAYSGHNYGPAGVIANMSAGQTVTIEGVGAGVYQITGTQYVSVNATTDEVYGLALQTCVGGDQMVVHYITQIG